MVYGKITDVSSIRKPLIPHVAFAGTIALLLAFGLVFLYLYTLRFHLQFFYPWIEIPLHILGGMVAGIVTYYINLIAEGDRFDRCKDVRPYIISIFLSAFIVGVMWELYEILLGFSETLNMWNTLNDLFFDMLGAGFIAYWARRSIKKECESMR